jgi:YggT family protein
VHAIGFVLVFVLTLFVICLFVRAILSWFPISYGSVAHRINSVLVRITEPVIAPVRRIIPPIGGGSVSIDLSFMVVVIVALIAIRVISSTML